MASIANDPNGRKRITFMAGDGTRKTIRLGKASLRQAESFRTKLEGLITWTITGQADDEVARWLAVLPNKMHGKLAKAELVKPRQSADPAPAPSPEKVVTLKMFTDEYFAALNIKPTSLRVYSQNRERIERYFGPTTPIKEIGPAEADKFSAWLRQPEQALATATIALNISIASMIFGKAVRWKRISENPFEGVKAGSRKNKSRQFFITRDVATSVLDACPNAEWRLIFALSRFGGLRCPSEHMAITWSDVNFDKGSILIHSSKTEHHEGKATRTIPLFPELRGPLMECRELAAIGEVNVITRYRVRNSSLRSQLRRILKRTGISHWPRLFHNLRSSRQTELTNFYPEHVVCEWLGNSGKIARDHYLQQTDQQFAKAVNDDSILKATEAKAAQICAHAAPSSSLQEARKVASAPANEGGRGDLPPLDGNSEHFSSEITITDIPEHTRFSTQYDGYLGVSADGGTDLRTIDSDIQKIVLSWPALPHKSRQAILKIIQGDDRLEGDQCL